MTKMNVPDNPARRVGAIMHNARMECHMSRSELAGLLNIAPTEMAEYEHGTTPIPAHILEYIFTTGYTTMRIRSQRERYRQQCRIFRKLKQMATEIS